MGSFRLRLSGCGMEGGACVTVGRDRDGAAGYGGVRRARRPRARFVLFPLSGTGLQQGSSALIRPAMNHGPERSLCLLLSSLFFLSPFIFPLLRLSIALHLLLSVPLFIIFYHFLLSTFFLLPPALPPPSLPYSHPLSPSPAFFSPLLIPLFMLAGVAERLWPCLESNAK